MHKRILLLLCFLSIGFFANAQLVHFTQDFLTPLGLNPGLTGSFYGTVRVNGVARDQDLRVTSNGYEYRSANASGEYNIDIAFRKQDWTSVGVNYARVGAGVSKFVRNEFNGSIAYHLSLAKKEYQVLSIGIAMGSVANSISNDNLADFVDENSLLNSGDQSIINEIFKNANPQNGRLDANKADYGLGLVYTAPAGRNSDFRVGVSLKQALRPGLGINQQNRDRLNPEITAFFKFYADINKQLSFVPSVLFSIEGPASRYLNLGGILSYQLNKTKDIYLNGGLGLRTANNSQDLMVFTGVDWNTWRFGLAFDVNMGRVANTDNGFGALELGVSKIIFIHKKPKTVPVLLCPRL